MGSTFDRLCSEQLIRDYPSHMKNNVHYECIMGSVAYGVSDDTSDVDIYGFCMPPRDILFPYSNSSNVIGFGSKPDNFDQFQKHHIMDTVRNKEYDISIYNIVKFFQLCMENNPNMVDALFVPTRCVLHSTSIGNHMREKRKLFLTKRVWHKFKGYAFSQLHKMKNKHAKEFVDVCNACGLKYDAPIEDLLEEYGGYGEGSSQRRDYVISLVKKIETNGKRSKRLPLIAEHGYDTKFAYHVVRLLDECEQILETGDLDLTRSREHLKAIRRGEESIDQIIKYFDNKLISLDELYRKSDLRHSPDEDAIKSLLLECIEMHYGSLSSIGVTSSDEALRYMREAEDKIRRAMRVMI